MGRRVGEGGCESWIGELGVVIWGERGRGRARVVEYVGRGWDRRMIELSVWRRFDGCCVIIFE